MRKFLRQIAIVLGSIPILLVLLDAFYTWSISETPAFGIGENEKVDCIFAGDSRTVSLRSDYISFIRGRKDLNISSPSYTLENNIELLEYFFRRGNMADRVVLQVDQKFGSRRGIIRNEEYMPHLFRENPLQLRIPFKYYAENNKNIRPSHVFRKFMWAMSGKPRQAGIDTIHVKSTHYIRHDQLLVDHSKERFRIEDIVALRDFLFKKGVKEVILYTPPHLSEWLHSQSDTASFKDKVKRAGFRYYDLSHVYSDTSYFKDYLHVQNGRDMEYCRLVSSVILDRPVGGGPHAALSR
jgi:hypothetical protein